MVCPITIGWRFTAYSKVGISHTNEVCSIDLFTLLAVGKQSWVILFHFYTIHASLCVSNDSWFSKRLVFHIVNLQIPNESYYLHIFPLKTLIGPV